MGVNQAGLQDSRTLIIWLRGTVSYNRAEDWHQTEHAWRIDIINKTSCQLSSAQCDLGPKPHWHGDPVYVERVKAIRVPISKVSSPGWPVPRCLCCLGFSSPPTRTVLTVEFY